MLAENLLEQIGFTQEEQNEYFFYLNKTGNSIEIVAKSYMTGKISFPEAVEKIHQIKMPFLHEYTIDLIFVLSCSNYLEEKYTEKGINHEYFIDAMKDIKYKLDECIKTKNVFGIFAIKWYEGFFNMQRFAFGRLQYNVLKHEGKAVNIKGYEIDKDDFFLECHIPSSGPLTPELCMDSFKIAYEFFKKNLKGGILPIRCTSWLLYPPYLSLFGENSNTADFARNFEITEVSTKEKLTEDWRIFGVEYNGDTKKLPSSTRLQKGFINYIESGKPFGTACGYILFDGEKVLTR